MLRFVPTNLTDPTGEFPFLAWVVKAGVEALADALMQATVNYFFDPNINTAAEAFDSIDPLQVGVAFVTGLLPGGNVIQSVAGALGDVLLNYLDALENCQEYTPEQAIDDFAKSFVIELLVSDTFDLIRKYGLPTIVTGLRKHGYDDLAERLLRKGDDLTDNGSPRDKDGPDGPFCSFRIDTPVMTDEGFVFIGELQAGDYVLAFNEATGEIGYYPILAVWAHEDSVIQYLTIDGEVIITTPNHPFKTGTGEWLPAGELRVGDTIHTAQGGTGIVQAISFVYDPQPMYNLTVAAAHTYFVGDGQWLVHNICPDNVFWGSQRKVNQAASRGWLLDDVQDVVRNPALTRTDPKIVNKATGNPVTYFYRADGHYAVIDDITEEIIQVSDLFNPNWRDEMTNLPIQPITLP